MRVIFAILLALGLTSSSTSLAHANQGQLCRGGEERALRARAKACAADECSHPTTGRFLSLDPVQGMLGEPLSTQGFTYAHANPTRFTDPTGEFVPLVVVAAIKIVAVVAAIGTVGGAAVGAVSTAYVEDNASAEQVASGAFDGAKEGLKFGVGFGVVAAAAPAAAAVGGIAAVGISAIDATAKQYVARTAEFRDDRLVREANVATGVAVVGVATLGVAKVNASLDAALGSAVDSGLGAAANDAALGSFGQARPSSNSPSITRWRNGPSADVDAAFEVATSEPLQKMPLAAAERLPLSSTPKLFENLSPADGVGTTKGAGPLVYSGGKWRINVGGRLRTANGELNFVVQDGQMFAAKNMASRAGNQGPQQVNGHVSLARGKPVEFAGQMMVKDGQLLKWDNNSGHYRPWSSANGQAPLPPGLYEPVPPSNSGSVQ